MDDNLFADLPLPLEKKTALADMPKTDQQIFRDWLNGVLLQQVDSFLTMGMQQVGAVLTGIHPCTQSPPEVTQAFKRCWVGAGRPTEWRALAADCGMDAAIAGRLVRRWLREYAIWQRETILQRLVLAGANDSQITRWVGASHAEIQVARAVVGVLPAFEPLTDALNGQLWRQWRNSGGGKTAEVLMVLHEDSGVSIAKLYPEVLEWMRSEQAIGR